MAKRHRGIHGGYTSGVPEEPEIETAELRQKIHEEIEREGGRSLLKRSL